MFIYDCSYVCFILYVLSVVVSLIGGGVPRMGPRVSFALLPFGHYPIKYLKRK
jgi:F0F1-type ATP synthase assembly protein I